MKHKKPITKKRLALAAAIFATLLVTVSVLIGIFELQYPDTYYPGVMINGRHVGGMTRQEVAEDFKATADALQKNGLTLILEGQNGTTEITIPASASGLTPDTVVEYFSIKDPAESIAKAYEWGHTGTIAQRVKEQAALILGKNFDAPLATHEEAIRSLLLRETRHHFIAQVPARFSIDKTGDLVIIPEIVGENMDMDSMVKGVLQKLAKFEAGPVTFKLQSATPYTTKERLIPFLELAKKLTTFPGITFHYKNHTKNVHGKTLVTWLALKPDNQVTIDSEKLETFFSASVAPFINNPPRNSRFKMANGELIETSPGKSGDVIDIGKTIASVEKIMVQVQEPDSKNTAIDTTLETITIEPTVTQATIGQYHIKNLIGIATTNFAGGSQDRQRNIEVGVSKITGMLIAPGEEFSTVDAIGQITEEEGFVKEYVISGDQTVKELGGGLCQLATTLFRTALNAGLPVTERKNHKYVIPYYGPGLDATIYGPHPDFRFVNDTDSYILLQGTAENNKATFELYGAIDGRTAEVSTPVLSNEKPVPPPRYIPTPTLSLGSVTCTTATHKGVTADTTYTVHYQDGTLKKTVFHSVYEAWPQVCLVGTAPN